MARTVSLPQQLLLQGLQQQVPAVVTFYYEHIKQKVYPGFRARYDDHQLQELEDCLSDAFLLFLQKIQEPHFYASNLDGFAFRIIHGKLRDRLKRPGWLSTTDPLELKEPEHPSHSSAYQFEDFLRLHDREDLTPWYHALDTPKRHLLELSLQGFNLKEAANYLGIAHGTARNWYSGLLKGLERVRV